ncbi:uncharacterized protein LOC118599030 [Oryzias melastigma]|uniref:uncharacterized protein LOC118599030 n=1 Tax=Oryzias melastigma TaxID=30732 RepID=UPI00168D4686|nr:uncharacterized protein LOC118599030 [Oryzias melastigma]
MAPETLLGSWNTEKSHVWSLGCIVAEMFLGFPLYSGASNYEVIRNITQNCGHFPDHLLINGSITKEFYFKSKTNEWVLKTPTECGVKISKDVKIVTPDIFRKHLQKLGFYNRKQQMNLENFIDLINRMLLLDPERRIPFRQVMQHPFVRGNRDLPRVSTGNVHNVTRQEIPSSSAKKEKKDLSCHYGKERKQSAVWIIGSGYYISGAQHTANQCFGENLGLNAKITWIGKVDMRWKNVLDTFNREVSRQRSSPDILVLHVGSNDLGNINVCDLTSEMVKDLIHLHNTFPRMKIAYSFITPRMTWAKFNPMKINADRIRVNRTMKLNAEKFNGCVIEHPDLTPFEKALFKTDGVQFSSKGFEMFVSSIRGAIEKTLNTTFPRGKLQPQSNAENVHTKRPCFDGKDIRVIQNVPQHDRKHISESDLESKLSTPENIRICEEEYLIDVREYFLKCIREPEKHLSPNDRQSPSSVPEANQESKNGHSSDASQSSPKRSDLKRKLMSETDAESDLPVQKKRKICPEDSPENVQSPPGQEKLPNEEPLLKRKRSSEDLSSPPKKRKVIGENDGQSPSLVPEANQELKNGHSSDASQSSPKRSDLKRKLMSETDAESDLPVQKKRKICPEDSPENVQSPPGQEKMSNEEPLLKRKRSSEDLSSPPKKRKVIGESDRQSPSLVPEANQELKNGYSSDASQSSPKRSDLKRKLMSETDAESDLPCEKHSGMSLATLPNQKL